MILFFFHRLHVRIEVELAACSGLDVFLGVIRVKFYYPNTVFSDFHNAHFSDDLGNASLCCQRESTLLQNLRITLLSVKHYDDNFRTTCTEVHSASHTCYLLARYDPVGQVSVLSYFHCAENCSSYVSSSYEAERFCSVKVFNSVNDSYISTAGVDDVNIQVGSCLLYTSDAADE